MLVFVDVCAFICWVCVFVFAYCIWSFEQNKNRLSGWRSSLDAIVDRIDFVHARRDELQWEANLKTHQLSNFLRRRRRRIYQFIPFTYPKYFKIWFNLFKMSKTIKIIFWNEMKMSFVNCFFSIGEKIQNKWVFGFFFLFKLYFYCSDSISIVMFLWEIRERFIHNFYLLLNWLRWSGRKITLNFT